MLRYKFRGKEKTIGWVYGSLLYFGANEYAIHLRNAEGSLIVDPETAGRFIGKKDIKNIPIYEGDIFKFKFMEEPNKPIELIGSFAWNDEDLRYEIDIYSNEYPEYICLYYIGNGQMYDFEIIGNIFDNAELLNN